VTRLPLLVLAVLFAALLAAPIAAADDPATGEVEVSFDLPANHGLHGHLENSSEGVTLEIGRKGRQVTYEVDGEVTEVGVKARFGKLGLIDVTFEPTETREDSPRGCTGPPSTLSRGFFVGTIQFTGEHGYVQIEETRVKGTLDVWRESEWKCPHHKQPQAPQVSALRTRKAPEAEMEPGSLIAFRRGCRCFFAAYAERSRRGRGPTFFIGAKFEKREAMEITRVLYAKARPSRFVFDHVAGTATVRPPQPFSGRGTFKRRPHGRDLWRTTIRVPLLGAEPLDLRGPGSHAHLVRDLPDD
jgi:hypothetical protein